MSIQYTGTTPVFDSAWAQSAGTKTELCSRIYENFISAGWTSIAVTGGSGARTAFTVRSAATPTVGNQCEVKCDTASTNCVRLYMQEVNGYNVQVDGMYLLPASTRIWNILINKFQFAIWLSGAELARSNAFGGVIYIHEHQSSLKLAIWSFGNGRSDTDVVVTVTTFRKNLILYRDNFSATPSMYFNTNNFVWESSTAGVDSTALARLYSTQSACAKIDGGTNVMPPMHWYDGSPIISDALIGWSVQKSLGLIEPLIKGQLWDAFISSEPIIGDSITTYDGHNWIAITDANYGVANYTMHGTLWLATT